MFIKDLKKRVVKNYLFMISNGVPKDIARSVVVNVQNVMLDGVMFTDTKLVLSYKKECGDVDLYRFVLEA